MNRLLLVDVDLVVAPSDVGWKNWLGENYGFVKTPMVSYNFGNYYPQKDSYSYWKDLDYFSMQPIAGSVDSLEKLSKYFGIVFVSAERCGYSSKNKKSWLTKYYPYKTSYICTEEKWVIDSNKVKAIIDDRKSNLNKFDFEKRILFNTPYTQDVECSVVHEFSKWDDNIIKEICGRYL